MRLVAAHHHVAARILYDEHVAVWALFAHFFHQFEGRRVRLGF